MTFPGSSCNESGVYGGQKSQKIVLSGFFLPVHVFFFRTKFSTGVICCKEREKEREEKKRERKKENFTDATS